MTSTADWMEVIGLGAGCFAMGAWVILLKLTWDDEQSRRSKGLNGLLRIQSETNLALCIAMLLISFVTTLPFAFLSQLPPTNALGDPVRQVAIIATRVGGITTGLSLFVTALLVVWCRRRLDSYQSKHGPHNRRSADPLEPDSPTTSSFTGPL